MFSPQIVQRITKYIILSALTLSSECLAAVKTENYLIVVSTMDPLNDRTNIPTVMPDSITRQYPYLYITTIIFGVVMVGTAFLIVLRSCVRLCLLSRSPMVYQPSEEYPVINRLRYSFVPNDPMLINGRFIPDDKPPNYASVVHASSKIPKRNEDGFKEVQFMTISETPPPSYGSIA